MKYWIAKMVIGKTLYAKNREEWRSWLEKNFDKEKEIWLIYYKKASKKERIPYDDAVEEALCFGWIDSTTKAIDEEKYAQRFSPRRKKSFWSEPNKERIKLLVKQGMMTQAGLDAIGGSFDHSRDDAFIIPLDILKKLKKDSVAWKNFQNFPESYKRIRISWIDASRRRPEEFEKRLDYFIKKTTENKRFGIMKISK